MSKTLYIDHSVLVQSTGADPAEIVTASQGRGTKWRGYNWAWSKEMQKEVRLWKSESGSGRDGQDEMTVSFLINKPYHHLIRPRVNANRICLNIHTKGLQLC